MAYREQWLPEIRALQKILAGFPLTEECKWGKPCYTLGRTNVILIQGFKETVALNFFQGALLKDPKKLLERIGSWQAPRVMRFTSAKEVATKAPAIKAFVREAIAAAQAGTKLKTQPREFDMPDELEAAFEKNARLKKAFEALTPGRQRSWLFHITSAKQSATRTTRIEKAVPKILAGRGFLER